MKILKRDKNSKKWETFRQKGFQNEAELQDIIYNDPRIIPIHEISEDRREIKVAIKEFGLPGAGSSDIIGIDEDGKITIIEAKLAVNTEIKRKVIGQILDYAAFLWKKTYEQFDEVVKLKKRKPLLDLMADLVDDENWSEEDFRSEVSNNLYNGDFSLFILVDDVDDSLKRILEFVNSNSFSGPQIYALAARYFVDDEDDEFLIPQIYGVNIKETESRQKASPRKSWNKESFFEDLKENVSLDQFHAIQEFYNFFRDNTIQITWGTGVSRGSFNPKFPKICVRSPFTVYSDGNLQLNFGWLNENKVQDKARQALKERAEIIFGVKFPKDWQSKYVQLPAEDWFNRTEKFISVIKEIFLAGKI